MNIFTIHLVKINLKQDVNQSPNFMRKKSCIIHNNTHGESYLTPHGNEYKEKKRLSKKGRLTLLHHHQSKGSTDLLMQTCITDHQEQANHCWRSETVGPAPAMLPCSALTMQFINNGIVIRTNFNYNFRWTPLSKTLAP